MNETTGQVDAVQPFDLDLEQVGGCLDAATVNVPFAFHLDGGGDDLLLFRVEEDGDDPELELRGRNGAIWQASVEIPVAPPGLLGERLDAALGDELAVAARRTIPGESEPAVTAIERADGDVAWTVEPAELPLPDGPAWLDVVAVTGDLVVLEVAAEEARDETALVALDATDGSLRWADDVAEERADVVVSPAGIHELVHVDAGLELRSVDPATGSRAPLGAVDASTGRLAVSAERIVAALDDAGLLVADDDTLHLYAFDVAVTDVLLDAAGHTVVLLSDGDTALAVTFGPS